MQAPIRLYSFGDVDRSGKVRWTAREIGLDIEESRLELGDQYGESFRRINPYAQVPATEIDGRVLIESTAICLALAERHPESGLIPEAAEQREAFWQSVAIATTSLETPAVQYALSKWGVIDSQWAQLLEKPLRPRLQTFANSMPADGCLLGDFTLADVFAAYVLRIGVQAGLLPLEGNLKSYIDRLRQRPGAVEARFFDSLDN